MDISEFTWGINRLKRFFSKKLNDEQEDEYFDRIKQVPNEIFLEAIDSLIDGSRYFPTPGDIKMYWTNWQRINVARMAEQEKEPCDDCHGDGALIFWQRSKKLNNKKYRTLVRCRRCENWKREFGKWVPAMTVEQVQHKGFEIIKRKRMAV